ncbi:SDR family NAD(P)-dependent oxidoreductase [Candidatus Nitrospira bockiana]
MEDRTVLVTGASGGLGRAIAAEFGGRGWRVGVHYRDHPHEAQRTADLVRSSGGHATLYRADVRDAAEVGEMVARCLRDWSRLDVLISCVGRGSSRLLLRLSFEEWASVVDTNLTGVFHTLKACGRCMLEAGGGSIVLVGSYAASRGGTGQAAYAASKAGLLGLMKSAASEWGERNVRVNMIFPGWHSTRLSEGAVPADGELTDHVLHRTPARAEVARTAYHLATCRDVSGQVWNLDSRII